MKHLKLSKNRDDPGFGSTHVTPNGSGTATLVMGLPGVVKPLAALEECSVRLPLPDARALEGGGQVHAAAALARLQHGGHQQPVTQHKLVVNSSTNKKYCICIPEVNEFPESSRDQFPQYVPTISHQMKNIFIFIFGAYPVF